MRWDENRKKNEFQVFYDIVYTLIKLIKRISKPQDLYKSDENWLQLLVLKFDLITYL